MYLISNIKLCQNCESFQSFAVVDQKEICQNCNSEYKEKESAEETANATPRTLRYENKKGWNPKKRLQHWAYWNRHEKEFFRAIPTIAIAKVGDSWIQDARLELLKQLKDAGKINYKKRNEITDYARRKIPDNCKIKIRRHTYYIL